MNQFEQDVYAKYRHLLTAQNRNIYAPVRRQNARAAIVDQFNIPYVEVKRIIALGDAETGITHEKPIDGRRPHILNIVERRETPIADLRVGDRIRTHYIDARILRIDAENIHVRGVVEGTYPQAPSHEFTLPLSPSYVKTLPVVVESKRKTAR